MHWDSAKTIIKLHTNFGVEPLFKTSVVANPEHPSINIIQLQPPDSGFPRNSYQNPSLITAYKTLLKDVAQAMGAAAGDAINFSENMFGYEKRIASHIFLKDSYEIIKLQELPNSKRVPVVEILKEVFNNENIGDSTKVLLQSPKYFKELSVLIATTDDITLNNFMIWSFVKEYLPFMNAGFKSFIDAYNSVLTGYRYIQPRWEFCTSLLHKYVPLAVYSLLDSEKFNESNMKAVSGRQVINNMLWTIKAVAKDRIKNNNRILKSTKSILTDKIDNLTLQVGVPVEFLSKTYTNNYHADLIVYKYNLLRNMEKLHHFTSKEKQKYLDSKQLNKRLLPQILGARNVIYNEPQNIVIVPRSLSSFPYFKYDYPRAINYGRLGVKISNMVIKVLIPNLSFYHIENVIESDVQNITNRGYTLNRYWRSIQSFFTCLQGGPVRVESMIINFKLLEELIGVTVALDALERSIYINDSHNHLPGLDAFEEVTLFLLSYSQDQCSKTVNHNYNLFYNMTRDFQFNKKSLFQTVWLQESRFQETLKCPIINKNCSNPV